MFSNFNFIKILLFSFLLFSKFLIAQETEKISDTSTESEEAKLAKAAQNPVAAIYSLPFQNNTTFINSQINL